MKFFVKTLLGLAPLFFLGQSVIAYLERVPFDLIHIEGNGDSLRSNMSDNYQRIAFYSFASNLVTGDTNNTGDVFLFHRATQTMKRISLSASGDQGNGSSIKPSLSADGRFIAFNSVASNLVTGDTNNTGDIFIYDSTSQSIQRIITMSGDEANGNISTPNISADGRFIIFASVASNLVPGDTNTVSDVFSYNIQTAAIQRISVSTTGSQGNNNSQNASPSADGRFIVFRSDATNLVTGDTNNRADIFLYDRDTNNMEQISVSPSGSGGNGSSYEPVVSSDGRFVAFRSDASNLVPGDTNARSDVFVRDRLTQTTEFISLSDTGVLGNQNSTTPSLSPSGRFVAFRSDATNLVTGDTNGVRDVFLYDRDMNTITCVSQGETGVMGNGASDIPFLFDEGDHMSFQSAASNLVSGDVNGFLDTFLYERNSAPNDISLSSASIVESGPTPFLVGTLTSTDANMHETHTYSFCSGADDSLFLISGSNTLYFTSVADYETQTSYSICIQATDKGSLTYQKSMILSVIDSDEVLPLITLVGGVGIQIPYGSTYTEQGAMRSDNRDGTGTINPATSGTVNTLLPGNYLLSYNYIDNAGNIGVPATRTVVVQYPQFAGGGGREKDSRREDFSVLSPTVVFPSLSGTDIVSITSPACAYEDEQGQAYCFARKYDITTINSREQAAETGVLIRQDLAKMMVHFSTHILGDTGNISPACASAYDDIETSDADMQYFIQLACSMGIMGVQADGIMPLTSFRPHDKVTRAEFGTVLSRALYGNTYDVGLGSSTQRYSWHLTHLHAVGYMKNISGTRPHSTESRGFTRIVLERVGKEKK